ncbi:hypothetical protein BCR36DRAFT_343976 [Piromyces finnis]|uniref:Translin-associated factor X-interacting protein 1 N-terminal domain-containing protein n=1 Tax=Piromyces finnis TaxID=1754191 RepID=A0A1Y1VKG4_9FUNG|nr:hypothetical protein BCR36DRAFT_343976 [Piromyces finnis]|eukprot:ORX58573.1 hypothetical protein BCR36DRAFT_343976 [Piromyces finnis]
MISKKSRSNISSSKLYNKQIERVPFRTFLHNHELFSPDKTSIPMANYSKAEIRNDVKYETINSLRDGVYHHRDSTKPKFLTQMIAYIKKEFAELGIENSKPGCIERLQVYKTVFDFFMEEFKTYQPILSDIKNEYELNLQNALKMEDEYYLIKSKYSVLKYQSEKQIEELKQLSKNEYEEKIDKLNREIERSKIQFKELKNEKELLEDKIDKLEIAEVNDERLSNRVYHLEQELERTNKYCSELIQQKDSELERLHDNVKHMNLRIFELVGSNNDLQRKIERMVPIDLYHSVVSKLEKCEDELQDLKTFNENMIMQNIQNESLSFRSALQQNGNCSNLEINWSIISSLCPNINIISYKRSVDKMDANNMISFFIKKLNSLNNIKNNENKEKDDDILNQDISDYFIGLGLQSNIPKFLRYEGKIINRMLSKRNCIMLINDIWKAKVLYDLSLKKKDSTIINEKSLLSDFLYLYLKKRFGAKKIIAEWGYNIYEACRMFGEQNVICYVFLKILKDEFYEDVYYSLINVLNKLKKIFIHYDRAENENEIKGYVSKKTCKQIFKQYWPKRSDGKIDILIKCIEEEQPEEMYNYQYFIYNSYYEYSTVNKILEQEMEDRKDYLDGLLNILKSVSSESKILGTDLLRVCIITIIIIIIYKIKFIYEYNYKLIIIINRF